MTPKRDPDERVSLAGLDPEEALRALLAVRPDDPEDDGDGVSGNQQDVVAGVDDDTESGVQ